MQRLSKKLLLTFKYSSCKYCICPKELILGLKGDGKRSGVGVGEVEPTTKVINATHTVWNLQKPAWNVRGFYFSGLVSTLLHVYCKPCYFRCILILRF